ncbi:MAG: YggS family pyridoxal phosphate-dependent enzyme [Phycisphaerae bacterium]
MSAAQSSVRRRLAENLKRVRDNVQSACARARRDPTDVRIVAVTKTVEVDIIRQVLEHGLVDIGESRGQQLNQRAAMLHEFVTRRQRLGGAAEQSPARPSWHMVGHLQRNKVRMIVPWVHMVHSVDSLRLAEELQTHAESAGRDVDILLQVNTSGERSKSGVAVGAVSHIAEHIAPLARLKVRGLMAMAPLEATQSAVRLCFDRLREVFEDMRSEGVVGREFDQLSMGMSNDYEVAVEAGATIIRLGHALFEGVGDAAVTIAADANP